MGIGRLAWGGESMPVEWRDSMSVGCDSIDADHKLLIRIINRFEASPDLIHAERTARALYRYAEGHFQREERLQRACRYPFHAAHHDEHEWLLAQLKSLIKTHFIDRSGTGEASVLESMRRLLHDWLVGHLLNTDIKMKPYLVGMSHPPPRAATAHTVQLAL